MTDLELSGEKAIFEILRALVRRCRILNSHASAKEMSKCAAIIAALRRGPERPPSGEMVMVPREPTEAMLKAFNKWAQCEGYLKEGYHDMLLAVEEGRKS